MNVTLNAEGKKLWGDVFPSGVVPVCSMSFSDSNVGRMVLVNWRLLTVQERKLVVEKISKLSNQPEDAILRSIEKNGLPLRESLTTGTIVAELRWFI